MSRPPGGSEEHRHDRAISIAEAVILSVVALLAAWSGYSAAKWDTRSSDLLGRSLELQVDAQAAAQDALQIRTFDSVAFDAAFSAYVARDEPALQLAIRRLRPGYRAAFSDWLAMKPLKNADAPADPSLLPQYRIAEEAQAESLTAQAHESFASARAAGNNSNGYVRLTVIFATVLFLLGISGHFSVRSARYALIGIGTILITYSVIELLDLPGPPG